MKKIYCLLLLVSIVTASCTPSTATQDEAELECTAEYDGFQCFGKALVDGEDKELFVSDAIAIPVPGQFRWVPVTATTAQQAGEWTVVVEFISGIATTVAFLAPVVAIVFNPNIVQNLAEGDPYIVQGDTISVYRNGQVQEFTIAKADANVDTQPEAQIRSQCQEQSVGCQATPTAQKLVYVIDDDARVGSDLALFFRSFARVVTFASCTQAYGATETPDIIILDGEMGSVYGWECIPTIRAKWPPPVTKIVAYSSAYETDFTRAGVDAYRNKAGNPGEFVSLIESLAR